MLIIRMLNLDIGKNKKLVVYQTNLNNANMLRLRGYWTCRRTMYRWYLMMVCEAVRTLGVLLDGTRLRDSCSVGRLRGMSVWLVMLCQRTKNWTLLSCGFVDVLLLLFFLKKQHLRRGLWQSSKTADQFS